MTTALLVIGIIVFSVVAGYGFVWFLAKATGLTVDEVCDILERPFR